MRDRTYACAVAMALSLAAAFPAAAGMQTDIPSALINTPADFWKAVMKYFYGGYNRSLKCWVGEIDDQSLCMRPHRLDSVTVDGRTQHFVVMGGYAATAAGGRPDCHACAGSLGLVVLAETGDRMELVARNSLAAHVGGWGQVPTEDSFRLREIGDGRYGWSMDTGWTGQGYNLGQVVIYGVSGIGVIQLGRIPVYADNSGTCGDGLGECFEHSYELVFDPGSGGGFHDIVLRRQNDAPDDPEAIRVPFDEETLKYKVPEEATALLSF